MLNDYEMEASVNMKGNMAAFDGDGNYLLVNDTYLMRHIGIPYGDYFSIDNITEIHNIQAIESNDDYIFVGNASGVQVINKTTFISITKERNITE